MTRATTTILLASALSVLGFGCAGQARESEAESQAPASQASATMQPGQGQGQGQGQGPHHGQGPGPHDQGMQMGMSCPMNVEGTSVRVEEVEGGASLVFTTTGDVQMLREHVRTHAQKMQDGSCPMMKKPSASR